jgi:hypothetical protein
MRASQTFGIGDGLPTLLQMNSMDKPIDQLFIKVSGKMFLGKKLAIDQEVTLVLKGEIVKKMKPAVIRTALSIAATCSRQPKYKSMNRQEQPHLGDL